MIVFASQYRIGHALAVPHRRVAQGRRVKVFVARLGTFFTKLEKFRPKAAKFLRVEFVEVDD